MSLCLAGISTRKDLQALSRQPSGTQAQEESEKLPGKYSENIGANNVTRYTMRAVETAEVDLVHLLHGADINHGDGVGARLVFRHPEDAVVAHVQQTAIARKDRFVREAFTWPSCLPVSS